RRPLPGGARPPHRHRNRVDGRTAMTRLPLADLDPREQVTVEIVTDPIPAGMFESLFDAFIDVAADYGLTIGARIIGRSGTARRSEHPETTRLRARVAELEVLLAQAGRHLPGGPPGAGATRAPVPRPF